MQQTGNLKSIKQATPSNTNTTEDNPMSTKTNTTKTTKTANKFGSQRYNARRKVVRLRTKELLSWAAIGAIMECSPSTARKLFQEQRGEAQHHDHLLGKGGRFPSDATTADTVAPYLAGDGTNNEWIKFKAKVA